jgi:hypothetical protein
MGLYKIIYKLINHKNNNNNNYNNNNNNNIHRYVFLIYEIMIDYLYFKIFY